VVAALTPDSVGLYQNSARKRHSRFLVDDLVHPVNSDLVDNGRLDCKAFALSDARFVRAVYLSGWLVS